MDIIKLEKDLIALFKDWECKVQNGYPHDHDYLVKEISIVELLKYKKYLRDIQKEVDKAESSIGLAPDGSYVVDKNTTYVNAATTIQEAIHIIDTILAEHYSELKSAQDEIDTIEDSIGLNSDGSYSSDASTTYLSQATSVVDALKLIDDVLINQQAQINSIPSWNEI